MFFNFCHKLGFNKFIYVACSGGVDSKVMLDLLYENFKNNLYYKLIVIFVKHDSQNLINYFWEDYCKKICFFLNIPLIVVNNIKYLLKVCKKTEEFYRNLRFFSFEIITYNVCSTLCVGQHYDDHVETVLYKILRGTGISGLFGITMKICLNGMFVIRPLLLLCKDEILMYAAKFNVFWLNDFSNFTNMYYRNYIRNFLITNVDLSSISVKTLTIFIKQNCNFLNVFCTFILYTYCCRKSSVYKLNMSVFNKFSTFLKGELIRVWFKENTLLLPKQIDVLKIYSDVIFSKNHYTYTKLSFCVIVKYGKNVYIFKY